jgi:hypothetical protein
MNVEIKWKEHTGYTCRVFDSGFLRLQGAGSGGGIPLSQESASCQFAFAFEGGDLGGTVASNNVTFIGSELKKVSMNFDGSAKVTNLTTCDLARVHGAVISMREHATNTGQDSDDGLEENFHEG